MDRYATILTILALIVLGTYFSDKAGKERRAKESLQDQLALVQTIKCESVLEAPKLGE